MEREHSHRYNLIVNLSEKLVKWLKSGGLQSEDIMACLNVSKALVKVTEISDDRVDP